MAAAGSPPLPTPPGPSFWLVQVRPPSSDQPTWVPKIVLTFDPSQSVELFAQNKVLVSRGWTAMEFSVKVRSFAVVIRMSALSVGASGRGTAGSTEARRGCVPSIWPCRVRYQTDQASLRNSSAGCAGDAEGVRRSSGGSAGRTEGAHAESDNTITTEGSRPVRDPFMRAS